MSVVIPKKYIEQAISRFESKFKKKSDATLTKAAIKNITISRQYGTGGRKIGAMVSRKLGCSLWGREILDVLASQSGWDLHARMFDALDEKAQGSIDSLISEFFGEPEKHAYLYLLPKAVCMVAQNDVVIVGRGAHLILPQSFRVRIEASLATRIRNVARLEELAESAARQKVRRIDKERAGFIRQLSGIMNTKDTALDYDLTINTDYFSNKNAALIIIDSFERWFSSKKK